MIPRGPNQCPRCGGEFELDRNDDRPIGSGSDVAILTVQVDRCAACGEVLLHPGMVELVEVGAEACCLSPRHRRWLTFEIYDSIPEDYRDPVRERECEVAWAAEIQRRVREVDEGKVELIPAEQVFADLRRMLDEQRRDPSAPLPPAILSRVLALPPKQRLALADALEATLRDDE